MKDKISQQHLVGAVLIMVLMIGISISTGFEVSQDTVEAGAIEYVVTDYETQAYGDYLYFKQINISNSFVSASLTNFPMLIHDDTGNLKDNVTDNASDIAFFDSTKNTQFNHEIERYISGTGELWAHVNITSVTADATTVIYMYYNDTDGSYPVGHNPESVWDSNFVLVQHLNGSTNITCTDATSNDNDVYASVGTPDYQQTGVTGYGVSFSKATEEGLRIDNSLSLNVSENFTAECWVKPASTGNGGRIFGKYNLDSQRTWTIFDSKS